MTVAAWAKMFMNGSLVPGVTPTAGKMDRRHHHNTRGAGDDHAYPLIVSSLGKVDVGPSCPT
jgi:hypothetical protein